LIKIARGKEDETEKGGEDREEATREMMRDCSQDYAHNEKAEIRECYMYKLLR